MRLTERAHKEAERIEKKEDQGQKLNRHERRFLEQYVGKAFRAEDDDDPVPVLEPT